MHVDFVVTVGTSISLVFLSARMSKRQLQISASSSSLQYSSKRGLGSELALESAKTVKFNSESHYVTTCHCCACLSCFQCRALLPIFSQAFTCMFANPSRPTKLCPFNMYPIYAPITLKVVGGMGENTQLNTIPLDMLLPSLARNH